jgi:hypothetical protein
MEELLQKLVENELLNEDTKKELLESFQEQKKTAIEEAVAEARSEVEAQVRVELQEQFQADKEALIEALDTKTEEYLKEHMAEFEDDVNRFRDLEAEYAEKLVEAKEELASVLKGDIEELVEAIDTFLDMRLAEEIEELREDIDHVNKLQFGKEIYEAFEAMFNKKFINENGLQEEISERQSRLEELEGQLQETARELEQVKRERKLDEVLEPLHGRTRSVMEAILKNVETDRLEEAYEHYIPRVLHESTETVVESEKESEEDSSVLAEGKEDGQKAVEEGSVIATGDTEEVIVEESTNQVELPEDVKRTLERLKALSTQ